MFKKIGVPQIILFSIIVLALILRFYNYPLRVSFDRDASLDALVARAGSQELQLPLTGPFSSAAPITTGPWYYYQMIIAQILIPSVYAPWISFALSSLILVLVMYRIGVLLKDTRLGLVLAFVAAISPVQISLSTGLGNASMVGQISAVVIWLFLEIILNKRRYLWQLFLGFFIGVAINYHFQSFLLLPFFIFLYFKRKTFFASAFFSLLGFFISFLPLLFFDLNNHWYNLFHSYNFLALGNGAAIEIRRWMSYVPVFWNNLVSSVIGVPKNFSLIIFFLGIIANFWLLFNSRQRGKTLLIPLIFFFQFLFLRYYRGPLRDNYVQLFHPFIFIFSGSLLYHLADVLNYRKLSNLSQILVLLIFSAVVFPAVINQIKPNLETLSLQSQVKELLQKSHNSKIAIYRCHNSNMTKPWSVSLALDMKNKLWKEGDIKTITNLDFLDEQKCQKEAVTPHTVYQSMVKWWYDEKP